MHALTHTHTRCTWRAQPHAAAPPSALAGVRAQPQRPKAAKPAAQRSSCVCGRQGGSQKPIRTPWLLCWPWLLPAVPHSGGGRDGRRVGAEAAASAQLGPLGSRERRLWPLGGGGTHPACGAGRVRNGLSCPRAASGGAAPSCKRVELSLQNAASSNRPVSGSTRRCACTQRGRTAWAALRRPSAASNSSCTPAGGR